MNLQELFFELYRAKNEQEVEKVLNKHQCFQHSQNWTPLDTKNNYGVIENQQASPIAALIEKLTNSIDATLMKKCYEVGIDPKSEQAPRSMDEAIDMFYPNHSWDLSDIRKKQAEDIQIIAGGYYKDRNKNTSLIIYDNGEGQHPGKFPSTFLSLLKGNKNNIFFVQGKYNMGGSGAIVFCGDKRYQLVASRRYDGTGNFGFTLVRLHPFTESEKHTHKNTWYEYFILDNNIPSFSITELDLDLYNRKFTTGSILKLYSYDLPTGSSSVISKDLNQSINEFLFEPALPILTIDTEERYPKDANLQRDLYGLKRRLEKQKSKYLDNESPMFSAEYQDGEIGKFKVSCYIFKTKIEGKTAQETKSSIKKEFFKNNMNIVFSMNGQVHGSFTSEFISKTLKFKEYLLVHVDCTTMNYEFRKELFMASRDRLKKGKQTDKLRSFLGKKLRESKLKEIHKLRRQVSGLDEQDTEKLIKSFAKNLPKHNDLMKLLNNTVKTNPNVDKKKSQPRSQPKKHQDEKPFVPNRFPSKFELPKNIKKENGIPVIKVPLNGTKRVPFLTNVENEYFDRTDEAGKLEIELLQEVPNQNDTSGGAVGGTDIVLSTKLNVDKSSPDNGKIKLTFNPAKTAEVGDEIPIKVSLEGAGETFEEALLIRITDPRKKPEKQEIEEEPDFSGFPKLHVVKEDQWEKLESSGISFNHDVVMFPMEEVLN